LVNSEFYNLLHDAKFTQTAHENEFYDASTDKWYKDLIYPDKDGISVYYNDITNLKKAYEKLLQSEEQLKLSNEKFEYLAKATNDGIWDWDITNDIFIGDETCCELFGVAKDTPLNYKTFNSFLEPSHRAKVFNNFLHAIKNKHPLLPEAFTIIKKDGSKVFIKDTAHIFYNNKGKAYRMVGAMQNITANVEAEAKLKKSEQAYKELAKQIENIREIERTNIAREIHDELGQQLTGLKMDITWLTKKIHSTDDAVNTKLTEIVELIDKTVIAVRSISTKLRPSILDDLGLISAMEWLGEEFEKKFYFKVNFIFDINNHAFNEEISTHLFRIFQESLTNISRHANATEVNVQAKIENEILFLNIEDNGIGFNIEEIKKKKTLGLLGMKERVSLISGTYKINSQPNSGTSILISVPLKNQTFII
jgi:PAS domain S-box-containing protein